MMKLQTKTFSFPNIKVTIDFQNKYVSSILFDGEEMIFGKIPFFNIKLRNKDAEKKYLSASEFAFVSFDGEVAKYHHRNADVILKITQIKDGLQWWVKVNNHTSWLIEQVELMTIGLCPKLIEEGGKGEIIIPYNEGARITSLKRRDENGFTYREVDYPSYGTSYMYPNMISSPFLSYIANKKGIYLGMHDKNYTPKHIDFRLFNGVLKTELSTFTNTNYGEDYEMDYPCVTLFFKGNFYDACDIYRNWFYENHGHELKTIKEKYHELPNWYHESPVVVTYPILGGKDSDTNMKPGGLYPYTNGLKVINHFSQETNSKILVTLMQWESTAPWAPPYVWPPYGDVDNFMQFRDELHKNGHYLGLYASGFGWTNESYRLPYNKTQEFIDRNLKDIMCTNSNGEMKSTIVSQIRLGFDVCPALDLSKQIFIEEANKMINANIDYVQLLDQNHGGNPYFCYSDKHGHVPAPGKWQIEETNKLLEQIDKSHCLLGCESAASEPYIGQLMFSDNRYVLNYSTGEPIPMYAYIYHEYVNNFMGNQICYPMTDERYSLTYRMAYSFVAGDMYTLVIDDKGQIHIAWCNDRIVDEKMPLTLIKNTNKWRIGKFEEYLHLGKMVKPVEYSCNKKTFGSARGMPHTYYFDAVLSCAYTNGKDIYQFFINYDDRKETIELPFDDKDIYFAPEDEPIKMTSNKIDVPPLSVIAIKIN